MRKVFRAPLILFCMSFTFIPLFLTSPTYTVKKISIQKKIQAHKISFIFFSLEKKNNLTKGTRLMCGGYGDVFFYIFCMSCLCFVVVAGFFFVRVDCL